VELQKRLKSDRKKRNNKEEDEDIRDEKESGTRDSEKGSESTRITPTIYKKISIREEKASTNIKKKKK